MESLYLDNKIGNEIIEKVFYSLFPDLTLFYYDITETKPDGLDITNPSHIYFDTNWYSEKSEFRFNINFYRTPEINSQERSIYIAKKMAQITQNRVMIGYNLPSNHSYPYYCLVFQNGTVYLADDGDTDIIDRPARKIKLLNQIDLEKFEFDSKGNFMH